MHETPSLISHTKWAVATSPQAWGRGRLALLHHNGKFFNMLASSMRRISDRSGIRQIFNSKFLTLTSSHFTPPFKGDDIIDVSFILQVPMEINSSVLPTGKYSCFLG